MGLSLGCLACCVCPAACGCCRCCPTAKSSTTTRMMYAIMLILGTITSAIFLSDEIAKKIVESNDICSLIKKVVNLKPGEECVSSDKVKTYFSYFAVYRIYFALAGFFFLFSLLMYRVRTSKDPRAHLQNGFWLIKWIIVIAIAVGAFYIPAGSFEQVMVGFGMTGAWLFIIIQLILLIDFAHSWNESWVAKYEEDNNKSWQCALVTCTFGMFAIGFTAFVLLLVYFTGEGGCSLNKFFIGFTFSLCVIATIISILPKVQDATPTSGVLQSGVVLLYCMYLTWTAVSNEPYGPRENCNVDSRNTTNGTHTAYTGNETTTSVIGIIVAFAMVLYACIYTSSSKNFGKLTGKGEDAETTLLCDSPRNDGGEEAKNNVYDNEEEGVVYSYAFFHFMCFLASLYLLLMMTGWYKPSSVNDIKKFSANWPSVWVKMTSAWVCVALYVWTLLGPVLLSDRDFGR